MPTACLRHSSTSIGRLLKVHIHWASRVKKLKLNDYWLTKSAHVYWASHARDPWFHARLHSFPSNQQCGIHMYTVFVHHIIIVSDINYHNMVKNTVYICIPHCWLPGKLWSLAWNHGSHALDSQCIYASLAYLICVKFMYVIFCNVWFCFGTIFFSLEESDTFVWVNTILIN